MSQGTFTMKPSDVIVNGPGDVTVNDDGSMEFLNMGGDTTADLIGVFTPFFDWYEISWYSSEANSSSARRALALPMDSRSGLVASSFSSLAEIHTSTDGDGHKVKAGVAERNDTPPGSFIVGELRDGFPSVVTTLVFNPFWPGQSGTLQLNSSGRTSAQQRSSFTNTETSAQFDSLRLYYPSDTDIEIWECSLRIVGFER